MPAFEPKYVKLDRLALRFYLYYVEGCDSSAESFRVRKCHLTYHVVDGTVEIEGKLSI